MNYECVDYKMTFEDVTYKNIITKLALEHLGKDAPIRVLDTGSDLCIFDPSTGRHYDATVEGICRLKEDRDELYNMMGIDTDFHTYTVPKMPIGIYHLEDSHNALVARNKEICKAYETCANDLAKYKYRVRELNAHEQIEKVIFNDPATIVFWTDGTKTVVQAHDEKFDKEKGLAMAIAKKTLGNKGNYFEIFKKYCGYDRWRGGKR